MITNKLLTDLKITLEALVIAEVQLVISKLVVDNPTLIASIHIHDAKMMIFSSVLSRMQRVESTIPESWTRVLSRYPELRNIFHPNFISIVVDEVLTEMTLIVQGGEWIESTQHNNRNTSSN